MKKMSGKELKEMVSEAKKLHTNGNKVDINNYINKCKEKGINGVEAWLASFGCTLANFGSVWIYADIVEAFPLWGYYVASEGPRETRIFPLGDYPGWKLEKRFYSQDEAIEWRNENIKRVPVIYWSNGGCTYNY